MLQSRSYLKLLVLAGLVGLPVSFLAYWFLKLVAVLQTTFSADHYGEGSPGAFGGAAGTLLLGVMTVNLLIGPPLMRLALLRSGEVGKKQGVDFAAGGH